MQAIDDIISGYNNYTDRNDNKVWARFKIEILSPFQEIVKNWTTEETEEIQTPPKMPKVEAVAEISQPSKPATKEPQAVPMELMRAPGFISQVMDACMESAPYPNQSLAFCGALALQSFLVGRKVCDPSDLRTNIYLLALAGSGSGKDQPRQVNSYIANQLGLRNCLADDIASGEGIEDHMERCPSSLFQPDEIDGLIRAVNNSGENRHEKIMKMLLSFYSSSRSNYPTRCRAGKEASFIDQPHLTLLGTATPKYYYEALNERMLSNGFFARMIIFDVGTRSQGQDGKPVRNCVTPDILETAKWWVDFKVNSVHANLVDQFPTPAIVGYDNKGEMIMRDFRQYADVEYAKAEGKNDEAMKSIWARANENARKLALLYACSENHQTPKIKAEAANWAIQIVDCQIKRMLYLASMHVADNEFHEKCLRVKQKLAKASGKSMLHSHLLKSMKTDVREFNKIIDTMEQQGDIEVVTEPTSGRPRTLYKLISD